MGVLLALVGSALASDTEFVARIQSVQKDGALRCKIIKFLKIDPDEKKAVERGKGLVSQVDVFFNEVALADSEPFHSHAIALVRKLCVGRKVVVGLGLPMWRQGNVKGDVQIQREPGKRDPPDEDLQMILIRRGLAYSLDDGKSPPDDVLDSAEATAQYNKVGMWSVPRRHKP